MNLISVVIPALRFDSALELNLISLTNQKNIKMDVWVVFNPTMPLLDQSRWPDWIHFIKSKKGVNRARNEGLKNCTSDLILFLDADCELTDSQHIQKLLALFKKHQSAAGVGGGYKISKLANTSTKAYNYLQMEWLRMQILSPDFKTKALIGGHMLLKKSMIEDFNFDENILFGGSEKEFFLRQSKYNLDFFLDLDLTVSHNSVLTKRELAKKAKAQGLGEKYIRQKQDKTDPGGLTFLVMPELDINCRPEIENYKAVFARAAGTSAVKNNLIKRAIFSLMEFLMITQSSRD